MKLSQFLILEDLEGKIQLLLPRYLAIGKKESTAKRRLMNLNTIDPTGQAVYLPWLARLDLDNLAGKPDSSKLLTKRGSKDEDAEKVTEKLRIFEKLKMKQGIALNKDIMSYKSFIDLTQAIRPFAEDPKNLMSKGEMERNLRVMGTAKKPDEVKKEEPPMELPGAKEIFSDATYKIIEISTPEAAAQVLKYSIEPVVVDGKTIKNGEGNWCVKDPSFSKRYLSSGNLYLVIKNGVKYVLCHKDDLKDVDDADLKGEQAMEIIDLLLRVQHNEKSLFDIINFPFLVNAARDGNLDLLKKILERK